MINIYDGNNILLRAMTTAAMPGQARLTLRQRLASTKATDIWVWDGINHNERRQAIYPSYKGQREPLAIDLFSQIKLFKELLAYTAACQINVPGWEADDVIATVVRSTNQPVTVHTNDLDYLQLATRPNVTLNGVKKPPCEPRWLPLYKALVGDSSDNIKGVPGFGPKSWGETAGYRDDLEAAIKSGSPQAFSNLPLPKSLARWVLLPGNIALLQNMLLITHMWEVSEDDLTLGITVGTPNPEAIDLELKKYFL